MTQTFIITPGEPAGIGPDITCAIAQKSWTARLIAIADQDMLLARAKCLNLPLVCIPFDEHQAPDIKPGQIEIIHVPMSKQVSPGEPSVNNAKYLIQTLSLAAKLCNEKVAQGIVTGPINKAIINQAGIPFQGHTEFLAAQAGADKVVMMLASGTFRVALVTTHLPLSHVPSAITQENVRSTLTIVNNSLITLCHHSKPKLLVCGLNPHAGEAGHMGMEEIDIITPVILELQNQGMTIEGPLPADTAFLPTNIARSDAIVAMFHDQGLPVIKSHSFGTTVNVTLGLPWIRTSVDHGTAFDLAGTGQAKSDSMEAAIEMAMDLSPNHLHESGGPGRLNQGS